jgi:hypothetical protein
MKPLLRTLGVAVLALALMNASAGLCFCHRGPVLPGDEPSSAGCCHGPEAPGSLVVRAAGSCCHIESTESEATPVVAIQFALPASLSSAVIDAVPAAEALPVAGAALAGHSPPPDVLRV